MTSSTSPRPVPPGARERLRARARRVTLLRRRITAAALVTFALSFGAVTATGSLGQAAQTTTAMTATTAKASKSTTSGSASSSSASGSTSAATAPVTTQQS